MQKDDFLKLAENRLRALSSRIEQLRSRTDLEHRTFGADLQKRIRSMEDFWSAAETQVSGLKTASEDQWSGLQAGLEKSLRRLGTVVQRFAESVEPAPPDERRAPVRYFLVANAKRGWDLKREGATLPTNSFERKKEALVYSREYVRRKAPSELTIQRKDGTFARSHRYR